MLPCTLISQLLGCYTYLYNFLLRNQLYLFQKSELKFNFNIPTTLTP